MKLKRWEIALVASLIAAFLLCAFPIHAQQVLADKIVRLHVLADSDSDEDQRLKLLVRDAVLAASKGEDGALDDRLLNKLRMAAQKTVHDAGYDAPVRVERETVYFETRVYDDFSLPAGYYDAVRVIVGSGSGRNWWCVIYPPLCAGVCEKDLQTVAKTAGLSDSEINLICEKGKAYVLRFKVAELWGQLLHFFDGK